MADDENWCLNRPFESINRYNQEMPVYTLYTIVSAQTPYALQMSVQTEMGNGWQPIGGIAVQSDNNAALGMVLVSYFQAMAK